MKVKEKAPINYDEANKRKRKSKEKAPTNNDEEEIIDPFVSTSSDIFLEIVQSTNIARAEMKKRLRRLKEQDLLYFFLSEKEIKD